MSNINVAVILAQILTLQNMVRQQASQISILQSQVSTLQTQVNSLQTQSK